MLSRAFEAIHANSVPLLRQVLRDMPDIGLRDDNNNTLLIIAAGEEHFRFVKLLVNAGADVNAIGIHSRTPINLAAEAGNAKILSLLLERGGDPNLYPVGDFYNGCPPIHGAAEGNSPKRIGIPLEYGADINARDEEWQRTELHVSLDVYPSLLAARYLILYGADIHARDKRGNTPLHEAFGCGARGIIALLRERGATE